MVAPVTAVCTCAATSPSTMKPTRALGSFALRIARNRCVPSSGAPSRQLSACPPGFCRRRVWRLPAVGRRRQAAHVEAHPTTAVPGAWRRAQPARGRPRRRCFGIRDWRPRLDAHICRIAFWGLWQGASLHASVDCLHHGNGVAARRRGSSSDSNPCAPWSRSRGWPIRNHCTPLQAHRARTTATSICIAGIAPKRRRCIR